MKTKVIFLLSMLLFVACTKEQQPIDEITSIDLNKPVLIQVEAVHEDGTIVNSPVLPLRF